ncbi:MAG: hypothetical protein Q7R30_22835 [Acidobacteriota bacterium]|nr:hypothetical protein [Acidobacteriota bacterium]
MIPTWARALLLLLVVYDLFWEVVETKKTLQPYRINDLMDKLDKRTDAYQSWSEQGRVLCAQIIVTVTFVMSIVPHLIAVAFLLQPE